MDKQTIQNQIVAHFWSKGLKQHIADTGHQFRDEELPALAYQFVPEYDQRLRLLGLIADHIPSVSKHARLCIAYMEESLSGFLRHGPGEVYDLCITEPNSMEERYLCDSYETALQMIDGFWEEYDFSHETPETKYTIVKRSVLHGADPFREDELARCELGPGKVLLDADITGLGCEHHLYCDENCMDCGKQPAWMIEPLYPPFIPNLTTVKFRQGTEVAYGITFHPGRNDPEDCLYIMPLGGSVDPDWWDHYHIPHPNADFASPEELTPEQAQAATDLRAFLVEWIKNHECT